MKTILVVDDEPEVLRVLGATLGKLGYQVIEKPDPFSALSVIREGAPVDLVITDHQMPGMKGSEFVVVLKQVLPSVPVIMLTAYGDVETYIQCRSQGLFEYVNKPVKAKELDRIIKAALSSGNERILPPATDA